MFWIRCRRWDDPDDLESLVHIGCMRRNGPLLRPTARALVALVYTGEGKTTGIGTIALYLALDVGTAVQDIQTGVNIAAARYVGQLSHHGRSDREVHGGYRSDQWTPLREEFVCDWRTAWFNVCIEPPSWVLGDADVNVVIRRPDRRAILSSIW